jgi:hypothetical protein
MLNGVKNKEMGLVTLNARGFSDGEASSHKVTNPNFFPPLSVKLRALRGSVLFALEDARSKNEKWVSHFERERILQWRILQP